MEQGLGVWWGTEHRKIGPGREGSVDDANAKLCHKERTAYTLLGNMYLC